LLKRFLKNKRGFVSAATIVGLTVSFLLVAVLGPIAIGEIYDANVTGWSASVKTIFQTVLPILWVVGVAVYFIPRKSSNR